MNFRFKLKYFLVKKLKISNKEAEIIIAEGLVIINEKVIFENCQIHEKDDIYYQKTLLQTGKIYKYYKLYKPAGIECTLNKEIPENLLPFLPEPDLFVVGRLDKASEGLLLLTNNGKIFDKTLKETHAIEKEYLVGLDKAFDPSFIQKMTTGVTILGQTTLPCKLYPIDTHNFRIILTEGKNRQIRRMCYKLGYEVLFLKRIRIGSLVLGNVTPGQAETCASPLD
jgi:23S rRNA pseudouridine2604 synthase